MNSHTEIELDEVVETTSSHQEGHTLYGEEIFSIGNFPVTNTMVTSFVALLVILVISLILKNKKSLVPQGIQNLGEIILEEIMGLCDRVTQNRRISEIALPIVLSIFVFVLINNWLGLIPGFSAIFIETSHGPTALFRGATADINTTLMLGLFSVLFANLVGIFSIGLWSSFTKYIRIPAILSLRHVRKNPVSLITVPVDIFVGLLELVGEVAKVASLSFRLFGNVFAGEVLLASMAALFAYIVPAPFLFLEFFVSIIQAFIIALLTVVYITLAVQVHEEGH